MEKRGEVDLSNSIKLTLKKHTQRQNKMPASLKTMQTFRGSKTFGYQKMTRTKSVLVFGNKAFQPSVRVSTFLVSQPLTFYRYFLYTGEKNADTSLDSLGIIHVEERLDLGFRSARSHRTKPQRTHHDSPALPWPIGGCFLEFPPHFPQRVSPAKGTD